MSQEEDNETSSDIQIATNNDKSQLLSRHGIDPSQGYLYIDFEEKRLQERILRRLNRKPKDKQHKKK